jgi:hypothetical protein
LRQFVSNSVIVFTNMNQIRFGFLRLDCSVFALARFLAAGSALAFALSLAPAAYAVDLFGASVVIPGHSFTATSSNVVNLISDMTHGTGQFAPVSGNAYKAGITYFGVPAAMQFTSNAAGTKITISSKITGLHQTFTGSSRSNVANQVVSWIKGNGASDIFAVSRKVDQISAAGVTDGNPYSTTALMATGAWNMYAFDYVPASAEYAATNAGSGSKSGRWWMGVSAYAEGGGFTYNTPAGGVAGTRADVVVPMQAVLSTRVSLVGNLQFDYLDASGTKVYGAGGTIGVPVKIFLPQSLTNSWQWRVTPFMGIDARGTQDGATGSVIYDFGLASQLNYYLNPQWVITMGNQISYANNVSLKIQGVTFDSHTNQWVLINGVRAGYTFWTNWTASAGVAWSQYLEAAAVSGWWDFTGQLNYRFNRYWTVSVNSDYIYSRQDTFQAWNVGAGVGYNF